MRQGSDEPKPIPLPDPYDPTPIDRGIGTYYPSQWNESVAIIEDRIQDRSRGQAS